MKHKLATFIAFLIASVGFAQDTPETAVDIIHSWSHGVFTCQSFEGNTDSPISEAEGPDIWLKMFTNFNTLVPYPYSGSCDNPWMRIEVFNEELEPVDCEGCEDMTQCYEWDIVTSAIYYISFTLLDIDSDLSVFIPFAATIDGVVLQSDLNGNGSSTFDDILFFLTLYGVTGYQDQDYNMDQIVDAADLLIFLTGWGQLTYANSCN